MRVKYWRAIDASRCPKAFLALLCRLSKRVEILWLVLVGCITCITAVLDRDVRLYHNLIGLSRPTHVLIRWLTGQIVLLHLSTTVFLLN